MTEKTFCLRTFFVVKYFRFHVIFYVKIRTQAWKKSPLSFSAAPSLPPQRIDVLASPPFENLLGASTSPQQTDGGGGVRCTLCLAVFSYRVATVLLSNLGSKNNSLIKVHTSLLHLRIITSLPLNYMTLVNLYISREKPQGLHSSMQTLRCHQLLFSNILW